MHEKIIEFYAIKLDFKIKSQFLKVASFLTADYYHILTQ